MDTKLDLQKILSDHKKWINDEEGGVSADLSSANLSCADLRGADLRSANLRSADLSSADLRSANLRGADLRSANLRSADLSSANLRSADGILVLGPTGSRKDMVYAVDHGDKIMFMAGCFWGDEQEFETAIAKTHGDNNYAKICRLFIEVANLKFGKTPCQS